MESVKISPKKCTIAMALAGHHSDDKLLWLRDMKSSVAGAHVIFECKYTFFQFLSKIRVKFWG